MSSFKSRYLSVHAYIIYSIMSDAVNKASAKSACAIYLLFLSLFPFIPTSHKPLFSLCLCHCSPYLFYWDPCFVCSPQISSSSHSLFIISLFLFFSPPPPACPIPIIESDASDPHYTIVLPQSFLPYPLQ